MCERCAVSLRPDAAAFLCSYECTFCPDRTGAMAADRPDRGGGPVRRPRRATADRPDGS
ncbi:DUF1272 domain-containing protein [Kitasatospora sp. NBC_01539]|uniref:DUF1272 domain-containing protein n=1 Tax=Kitasatospora sp. NBC_01539 TaxID=2903577 RepID=UPI0038601B51